MRGYSKQLGWLLLFFGVFSSGLTLANVNREGEPVDESVVADDTDAAKDIVQTAIESGKFSILVNALGTAELLETLKGAGPFTLFAPTDAAFRKLGQTRLNELLKDRAKLKLVLLHHVVQGDHRSKALMRMAVLKSMEGQELPLRLRGRILFVKGARVLNPDIIASNGVIHGIGNVLFPEVTE